MKLRCGGGLKATVGSRISCTELEPYNANVCTAFGQPVLQHWDKSLQPIVMVDSYSGTDTVRESSLHWN